MPPHPTPPPLHAGRAVVQGAPWGCARCPPPHFPTPLSHAWGNANTRSWGCTHNPPSAPRAPPLPPPALHQLPRDGDGWAGDGSRDGTVCPWISPPVPRNAGMHRFSARLLLSAQFCLRSPGRPQRRALSVQCEGASRGQPPLLSPAGSNRDRQRQPLPGGGTRGPGWGLVQPEAAGPQPRGGCGGDGTRRDARCALGTQQGRGAPLPGGRLPASWAGSFGSGTGMRHAGTPLGSAQPPLGPSPRG